MTLHATRLSEEAAARGGMYRLLGRLWLREVDRNLLQELRCLPLHNSFCQAGGAIPACDDGPTIEELEIDYCRLFIGPSEHLPPFQSVWESGQFQSATAASMRSFIDVVRYDAERLPSGMMLDHIGVQLDVMGHILGHLSTWQSAAGSLDQVVELATDFFARHLMWPMELLDAAIHRSATDFYRSSIMMTREFLRFEMPG